MAFRSAYSLATDTPSDQFQRYTRSAGSYLVMAALGALALGIAVGSLNAWEQYERFDDLDAGFGFRFYFVSFFSYFALYGLIAAVLFAGGLLISALAWFHLAIAADFDDLFDDAGDDEPDDDPPSNDPSEWTRPVGSD
jgi:hypothetical protein